MKAIFIPHNFEKEQLSTLNQDLMPMRYIVREFNLGSGLLIIVDNKRDESEDKCCEEPMPMKSC